MCHVLWRFKLFECQNFSKFCWGAPLKLNRWPRSSVIIFFFISKTNSSKIFMFIFYNDALGRWDQLLFIHFYSLFRFEKNVNNLELWLSSSNQGIAIGAEVFRFFECLHTAWDTRAADTSENNILKLFYLKANSWLNIFLIFTQHRRVQFQWSKHKCWIYVPHLSSFLVSRQDRSFEQVPCQVEVGKLGNHC